MCTPSFLPSVAVILTAVITLCIILVYCPVPRDTEPRCLPIASIVLRQIRILCRILIPVLLHIWVLWRVWILLVLLHIWVLLRILWCVWTLLVLLRILLTLWRI